MSTPLEQTVSRRKATGAHFTPPELALVIARRLLDALPPGKGVLRILDPCCGDGALLNAFCQAAPRHLLKHTELLGVEEDETYLRAAKRRISKLTVPAALVAGNFLDMALRRREHKRLRIDHAPPRALEKSVDAIIANPPYVRTQILGADKAQALGDRFGLTGRVDLYQAFLIAMTEYLRPGGTIGVITSNRYLTTKGGARLREYLAHEYDILEILDLGDTRLFAAAVLPAIFIGRKKILKSERPAPARFVRVYEAGPYHASEAIPADSVCDLLRRAEKGTYLVGECTYRMTTGRLTIPARTSAPWTMTTREETAWVQRVHDMTGRRIGDVARIRVGIKTTADGVFIRTDWDDLPPGIRPEPELLRPLISHADATRWKHDRKGLRRALYTHEIRDGKRRPIHLKEWPGAAAYLKTHRDRLESRTYVIEAGRSWYEIWVPQDPAAWSLPKLVFPDISASPKFLYDGDGSLVDGNCYWATTLPEVEKDVLFLIMAVANSRLMTRYHDLAFQNRLYAGRRRYLTQYVEQYPLPFLDSRAAKHIIEASRQLALGSPATNNACALEEEIEVLVAAAFGLETAATALTGGRGL